VQGDSCTYAEEMTNYANWYAYYSTRMQAMKTADQFVL
jgi:type IV pilus assembly protein PilY1